MICAVHQPNFFPWLGYFDKIRRADRFVVLDDAQYPRTGAGTWMNRVALLVAGERRWVTAPVRRPGGTWTIAETRFAGGPWREKLLRTVQGSYGRAAAFREHRDLVLGLIANPEERLVEYNLHAVASLCRLLGIDFPAKVVRASSLGVATTSTRRLADLTLAAGCDTYLSGGGAGGYQEEDVFARAGVRLVFQDFRHPVYPQAHAGPFVGGLSVLDYILNGGAPGGGRAPEGGGGVR